VVNGFHFPQNLAAPMSYRAWQFSRRDDNAWTRSPPV